MNGKSSAMVFGVAVVIAIVAGAFYFFVDGFSATKSAHIEEPYKRTADAPPSAVQDETSSPELKTSPNGATQP